MTYDPDERRDTPLARKLARQMEQQGPLTVRAFMDACLNDPGHGYYRVQDAIGAAGDFVTAPEISQIFGELIGLWVAVVWQQLGAPSSFTLAELGPGRGTMMADAMRAAGRVPGFADAVRVALVEPSPALARIQRETLAGAAVDVRWHRDLGEIDAGPVVVVANEVLDAVPVAQWLRTSAGWHQRGVGLDPGGKLAFVPLASAGTPVTAADLPDVSPGEIVEERDLAWLADAMAHLARSGPTVGLFIDYGHKAASAGDTLQAVRAHRHEHPLSSPGEADLTAHVDFAAAARAFTSAGLVAHDVVTQAELLGALGAAERASRLMAANPGRAAAIEMAVARLMAPGGMGTRFKALAVTSPGVPKLPGFP